ncbi:acyl-CoA dehydrogenase family protein [Bacillus sp. FJAT-50079]|uniref:acyl-CoA dehydrogenase family protein n=1 Tax=Bacillus sp. FJAT-50079 TaxID=2833577 RepID=UPI001BC9BAB8|nr:acyl-CoA dehydrogenase family protein [Bacillus sp. FJAT-50079]MBS4206535.1 acyl-CoA/acyl-ACP dehydrogenase [Bacillus sp. FJAT-50079]
MSVAIEKEITADNIRVKIRKLVEEVIRPNAEIIDREKKFPRENLQALAKDGWNSLLLPKELGGLNLDYTALGIAVQEIAKACPSTALIYTMNVEATLIIYKFGNEEQWHRWLKPVREGKIGTTATSEKASGGQYWINLSRAEHAENGYTFNFEKSFATSSGQADFYIIQTGSPNAIRSDDLSYFIVDAKRSGIETGEWDALGVRGNYSSSITFNNFFVPEQDRIGEEGIGREVIGSGVGYLLGIGATWTGTAIGIYEEVVAYAKHTIHRNAHKNLADYQVIRHQLTNAKIVIESLKAWQKELSYQLDEWQRSGEKSPPSELVFTLLEFKVHASEAANTVAQISMDVAGGYGYKKGTLERLYRDARAGIVMGPSNNLAKEIISKHLVGLDADLWALSN